MARATGQPSTPEPAAAPAGTTFLTGDAGMSTTALRAALDEAAAAHGGRHCGDEPAVVAFPSAPAALDAAVAVRRIWRRRAGPDTPLRLAVHTGDAHRDEDGRVAGPGVGGARRLCDVARPGQTLVAATTATVSGEHAPLGATLHDLGLHRLRDLSPPARVFALVEDDDSAALRSPRSLDSTPNNLPVQARTFVGRETELAELRVRLAGARLLTITGPGGSGKTRLAGRLAAELADRWPDGVWWVELGDVADAASVVRAVAEPLGVLVVPAEDPIASLGAQLAGRRLLLCLDNCEHVLDAAASAADGLRSCPEVAIVATSREPLGLTDEVVWRVPPLPPHQARALFVERATQTQPDLMLDDDANAAIASMCARLDGSPLALELAAAWLPALTPGQIEAGLDDRFSLLVRSPRDAVPRQSSLLASMAWSHDLLDARDRAVLRRLAVFAGGFDLAAARDVCAGDGVEPDAVLGAIARLVDKSLVVAQEAGGEVRYRLPETIRQFAEDRLRAAGERQATADRHLDHMHARVRAAAPDLDRDKDRWRRALARERDNLQAAIEHGLEADDPARGRELAAELPWLWHLHRQGREGMSILRRAIARAPDERSALQARLLAGIALVADTADPLDTELDAAQRATALAAEHGDERLLALCVALTAVGRLYTDLDGAAETALESERIAERAGDRFVADAGRALRGIVLHLRDEHARARVLLTEAADGLAARGDRGVASTALAFLAGSALLTGDVHGARELGERSIATAAPLADHLRIGMGRSALALALGAGGDIPAGLAALQPLLPLVADGGSFLPEVNRAFGLLHLWAGKDEQAAGWLGTEARSTDGGRPTYLAVRTLPALAAAQRSTGRSAEAAATAELAVRLARERDMPSVLADGFDEQARQCGQDEPERALDLHHEALAIRAAQDLRVGAVESLEALAAVGTGAPEQDARLLAAAGAARAALSLPVRPVDRSSRDALEATLRRGPGADEAWAAGAALSLDDAVAYARRARGPRRRPDSGWASLTPAELEVVRLTVDGLTNPQIGARLFMSRSTVKSHLSHVYAKLDVANRTELAAVAAGRL